MAEKEKAKLEASKESRRVTFGPSNRSESLIYDTAVDDEFAGNPGRHRHDDGADSMEDESHDSDGSSEIEVRLGNVHYSDDSEEEIESSSDEESEEEDEEEASDEEEEEEESDDDSSQMAEDNEQEGEEIDFFEDYADEELHNVADQVEGAGAGGNVDEGMMEGWTRVDNSGAGGRAGLGNMLLDMVGGQGQQNPLANGGGFMMDAAESMLGNLLRGELGLEGLSEIEDSLGIRVVRGDGNRGVAGTNRTPEQVAGRGAARAAVHQAQAIGNRGLVEFR